MKEIIKENLEPKIEIITNFVENTNILFNFLKNQINWSEKIKGRKTASFGVPYNYSGITYPEVPMLDVLLPICQKIATELGFYPNNCLINYYLDGNSKMGYHSDSAAELKEGTGVVIVSLGAERVISYRSKLKPEYKVKYKLENGTLLYMENDVQKQWMHGIPKTKDVGERISLAFRQIIKH
jgi:hypothetical protein